MKRALLPFAAVTFLLSAAALAGHGPCKAELDDCLSGMGKQLKAKGWVGIELDRHDDGTLAITRVLPASPAEAAGLQAGDRILALNGVSYATDDRAAMKNAYAAMVPDNTITYTIDRGGKSLEVDVRLARLPEHIRAQWIALHLVDGHSRQASLEESSDP